MKENRCQHCHNIFLPNPRVKNQQYCHRPECQRARKARWQRQKMAEDSDYQSNQKEAWKTWSQQHLDYWKTYRSQHLEYVEQNRSKQGLRDKKRQLGRLAKMDAFAQKIFIIPDTSTDWPYLAKKDSIDFRGSFF